MGLPIDPDLIARIGWIAAFFISGYRHLGSAFRYMRNGEIFTVLAGPEANLFITREGREILSAEEYRRAQNEELGIDKTLVSMDGEEHRRHRQIQQRGYARAALDDRYPDLVSAIRHAVGRWPRGEPILVRDALPPLIAELLGIGVINHPIGDHFDDVALFVRTVVIETVAKTRPRSVLDSDQYKHAKARSLALADRVIAAHQATSDGPGRPDLVDDLLAAWAEDPELMTEQELRIAVLGGYIGGLDTVAYTCAFMLYALLAHPHVLTRVQEEIDSTFAKGMLTPDALAEMKTLHCAALETLRLYPLSAAIQAKSGKTFTFEGFEIPAGANLTIATTVPHFLETFYEQPLAFDIDRFTEPRNEHRNPGAYAPFGLGPHVCLGAAMARSLISLTMATLLHTVDLEIHPADYELTIGMIPVPVPEDFHIIVRGAR